MNTFYPTFLILYSYQLSLLHKNCVFEKIKKKINCYEIISIFILILFSLFQISLSILIVAMAYQNDWFTRFTSFRTDKKECESVIALEYFRICFIFLFFILLFIGYMVLYKILIRVMQSRLFYFYQLTKKNITILCLSGIIYFFWQSIFTFFDIIFKEKFYVYGSNSLLGLNIFFSIIGIPLYLGIITYGYLSTKYIDFVLYIRAWMIGYQVIERFDNMSYFITSSCFCNHEENDEDSDQSIDIRIPSEYNLASIKKSIIGEGYYSSN